MHTAASIVSGEIGTVQGAAEACTAWSAPAILAEAPTSFAPQSGIRDREPSGPSCASTSAAKASSTMSALRCQTEGARDCDPVFVSLKREHREVLDDLPIPLIHVAWDGRGSRPPVADVGGRGRHTGIAQAPRDPARARFWINPENKLRLNHDPHGERGPLRRQRFPVRRGRRRGHPRRGLSGRPSRLACPFLL